MHGSDDLQRYMERVRPLCTELYRRAHIIVGNADIAEFVMQNAIADAYARRREWQGRVGLRETLTASIREEALDELNRAFDSGSYERDPDAALSRSMMDSLAMDSLEPVQEMLLARLLREKMPLRRMVMLRYGCGLNTKEIAFVMRARHGDVKDKLRLLSIRTSRALKRADRVNGASDRRLEQLAEAALCHPGEDVPDIGTVFQHFGEMAEEEKTAGARIGRVMRAALLALGALLCAMLFWLIAVLLEPRLSQRQDMPDTRQNSAYESVMKEEDVRIGLLIKDGAAPKRDKRMG